MKKTKIISLLTAILCTTSFYGCNDNSTTETAENTVVTKATLPEANAEVSTSLPPLKKITGTVSKTAIKRGVPITRETTVSAKAYSHSDKVFKFENYLTSLFMVNGWEIISGGTATDQQTDYITSVPAVLQYLDTKTTLTITVVDEIEDKEEFLAGTEETYKAVYGSEFDSIDITEFEQLAIDEKDSFRIKADVVVKGEKFTMIHILSNDVSGSSYSFMLLDSDGEFSDFDLAEAISYPKQVDTSWIKTREELDELIENATKFNIDDYR